MCKMHRCWAIVEVQHIIFREVLHEFQGKATLARLARTCRTISNVALDLLWEELTSFVNLIRCLPRTLWTIDQANKRMRFQRTMWFSDWEILFKYSSRVRVVSSFQSDKSCSSLAANVVSALSHLPHFGPLLPNLQSLRWTDTNETYAPLLHVLLANSLVDVLLPSFALRFPAFSMRLAFRCPSLNRLDIANDSQPLDAGGQKILSETIMRLHSLESFSSGQCALDESAIVHFSRLPSLFELSLKLRDNLKLKSLKSRLMPPVFESLECLTLKVNELSTLTSLLEVIHFAPHTMSLSAEKTPTSDAFCLFFMALAKACDPGGLSSIALTTEFGEWLPSDDRQQISLSTLEPLLAFPNIESFTFDAMCNISLDDEALDTLTKCWPNLTKLSLNQSALWGIEPHVTHRGLITLLSRCAALTKFALAVDFTGVDSDLEVPMLRPGNGITSGCKHVDFITSKIGDPANIAAFLSDLFPGLREVSLSAWTDDPEEVTYLKRWEAVNNLLPKFLAVRTQCKEWYEGKDEEGNSGASIA